MDDPELRIGIIGVGPLGADHAHRIARRLANARLVAVPDPVTARAQAVTGQYDGVRAISDVLGFMRRFDPEYARMNCSPRDGSGGRRSCTTLTATRTSRTRSARR
jgi:hypothetical protein